VSAARQLDLGAWTNRVVERVGRVFLVALGCALIGSLVATVSLRWLRPPTTAFMVQARVGALLDGRSDFSLRHDWVYWEAISPHAGVAVVAAEDQRFPMHSGFDFDAIGRALRERAREGRIRGASTISQQVSKNIFLWSGRSLLRKGAEAYLTVLLEALVPKRRILELYLNIAEFGDGIYGVEAASQIYFRKPSSKLSRSEAALLAAVLPSPRRLHPDRPSEYVRERRQWILAQMTQLGGSAYLHELD
jgi:monofunctional biosynthetic peptidoglycan transglycosylase